MNENTLREHAVSVSEIAEHYGKNAVQMNRWLEEIGYQVQCTNYSRTTRKSYVGWKPTAKAKGLYEKMPYNRLVWYKSLIARIDSEL